MGGGAGRLPENRAVVEDDIDANELLESGEAHAGPENRSDAARFGVDQIGQPRAVLAEEALLDLANQAVRVAADAGENGAGEGVLAVGDKITRGLGDEHRADEEGDGGDGFHPEHPAPGGLAERCV